MAVLLGAISSLWVAALTVNSAYAQELGVPVADGKLDVGSISVHVVGGNMSRPLSGLDVSLIDDASGKERVVRTGPDGRAPFRSLKAGQRFTAFIKVGDKEISSQPITMPSSGGLQVLLSPTPIRGGNSGAAGAPSGHAGPMSGGAGGMPDPRRMSGMPRGEQKDRAGMLTVRTIAGKFRNDEIAGRVADFPEGAVVHLVGYHADGSVTAKQATVDAQGRVQFPRLAVDQTVSYWALASFARNGQIDRLMSMPIEPPPQVGLRLMLAGLAEDSTEPGVDDLLAVRESRGAITLPPAGEVQIDLLGQTTGVSEVQLVNVDGTVVANVKPASSSPISGVVGRFGEPTLDSVLRDGVLVVELSGLTGKLAGIPVSVSLANESGQPIGKPLATVVSDAKGNATFEGGIGTGPVVVTATVKGKTTNKLVTIPSSGKGVKLAGSFSWKQGQPVLRATFSNISSGKSPGQWPVLYARTKNNAGSSISAPFQMVDDRGVAGRIFLYPKILFKFAGSGELDDDKLWFQLRMEMVNPSMRPLDPGQEGFLIPLPKGFVGASVAEESQSRVRVDEDHGFIWKGPLPPGTKSFIGQFAIKVDDGAVDLALPLPYGAYGSHLVVEDFAGMQLDSPPGAQRQARELSGRPFIMLGKINHRPGENFAISIVGLPQGPGWKTWGPRIAGFGVLALLAWGLGTILFGRRKQASLDQVRTQLENKREKLLARLVDLDGQKPGGKQGDRKSEKKRTSTRKSLVTELEEIYEQLEQNAR